MKQTASIIDRPDVGVSSPRSAPAVPDPLKGGDVYGWAMEQATLIHAGRYAEVDWINVADEIESVVKLEQSALTSELTVVVQHMLKWDYQPQRPSRSWELSIREHRRRARRRLDQNPGLGPKLDAIIADAYEDGRDRALAETRLRDADIPAACAYSPSDLFDRPFVLGEA